MGAAVGGNLTLILLDVAWDRRAHDRFAEMKSSAPLEARPSNS
ncbi:MAG: hypothetical protein ACRDPZ_08080 [Gaiellaceae bacterium]